MHVANEDGTFFAEFLEARWKIAEQIFGLRGVGDFVGAHIDHCGAGIDPIGGDEAGLAHGGDNDVGATHDVGEIARFRMANGNGGVGVHEQERHGFANNVAAAENDSVGAFDGDMVATENFHAAGGGAGHEAGASANEAAEIDGVETVNVFGGVDGFEDALGVDLFGKRELDEDAVDAIVAIEFVDEVEQIVSGAAGGWSVQPTGEAEVMAGFDFAFHVELRGGIFSDENGGEPGADVLFYVEFSDGEAQFSEDFVADFDSVEEASGHAEIIAWREKTWPVIRGP